jgi:hypothetical protein
MEAAIHAASKVKERDLKGWVGVKESRAKRRKRLQRSSERPEK